MNLWTINMISIYYKKITINDWEKDGILIKNIYQISKKESELAMIKNRIRMINNNKKNRI